MSDMVDLMRDLKKIHQNERADNRVVGANHLTENNIPFSLHNGGAHIVIQRPNAKIDYWPGTGKFNVTGGAQNRGGKTVVHRGYDLAGLCDYLGIPKP